MISLKHNGTYLDIQRGSVTFDISNPLFGSGIPGLFSSPFKLSGRSKINNTLLGHSKLSGVIDPVYSFSGVQMFVRNVLWKIGQMEVQGGQDDYDVNFRSDAGDLSETFNNKKLSELSIGTETRDMNVVNDVYPNVTHTYFPVYNPDFYSDKNDDFKGYVNYYHSGAFLTNSTTNDYCIVPFIYLKYIIEKIFNDHGWYVQGSFLDDADILKAVIYNNYALDSLNAGVNEYAANVDLTNHVPDITIGKFLSAIKNMFGLGYFFDPKTKTVTIKTWQEVLADQGYDDWFAKLGKDPGWSRNEYRGITFMQNVMNDQYTEDRSFDWTEYRQDDGEASINTPLTPLLQETREDHINTRDWTIPVIRQTGSSPEFDIEINDPGFRIMFFDGFKNDSLGNPYPAGRYATASQSLRWDGANGLINTYWQNYIDFKKLTRRESWDIHLNVVDLLNMDTSRKKMLQYQKYIIENIKVSVSDKGIKAAKVKVWKTGL